MRLQVNTWLVVAEARVRWLIDWIMVVTALNVSFLQCTANEVKIIDTGNTHRSASKCILYRVRSKCVAAMYLLV